MGLFGKCFLPVFLNKPYIDKTFQPASMENAYLDSRMNTLIDAYEKSSTDLQKNEAADKFLRLLQKVNIKYVLVDETIGPQVVTRNILYTSKRSYIKIQEMMDLLKSKQLVELSREYQINIDEFMPLYRSLYPITQIGQPFDYKSKYFIQLYVVKNTIPVIQSVDIVRYIDKKIVNLFETDVNDSKETLLQGKLLSRGTSSFYTPRPYPYPESKHIHSYLSTNCCQTHNLYSVNKTRRRRLLSNRSHGKI